MRQTKLQLSLAVSLALASGPLLALGLGQIEVKSNLSQPLLAEIPIASSNPGELDSLSVALASPEAFARVGLDRPLFLAANLEFSVGRNERGENVIRVSTSKPVDDPFVSFLLEADWGSGKLVREFSVLLDPPYLAPSPRAPVSPARVASAAANVPRPSPASPPAAPVQQAAAPVATAAMLPSSGSPQVGNGQFGPVERGQTLSQIANALRPAGVGLNQMMVALLRANASAFIDGNVNQLKRGAILRIPGSDELAALSAADAAAIVREQTEAWQNAREPQLQPVDSRATAAAPAARASAAADGRLSIVPPSGAQARASQSGASAAGEGTQLRAQLSEANENLAARDGELKELRSRVSDLEKLRDSNNKLVALKDSELAALQQRLRDLEQARTAAAALAASDAAADTPPLAADADVATADTTPAGKPSPAVPAAATSKPAVAASPNKSVPTPPPPVVPATPWYLQTLTLAGLGVLLVGLLSLVLLRRKPKVTSGVGAARKRGSDAGSLAASIDALRASPEAVADEASDSRLGFDEEHLRELRANAVMRPEQLEAHLALLRYLHAHDMAEAFEDAATDMLPHVLDSNGPQWREACAMGSSLMPDNALFDRAAVSSDAYQVDADADAAALPLTDDAVDHGEPVASEHDEDFERALAELDAELPKSDADASSAWDDSDATSPAPDSVPGEAASAYQSAAAAGLADDQGVAGGDEDVDDASETKLDLAQAYIDIGDSEAAHALLDEVLNEGSAAQRLRAERLLADLR